MAHFLLPAVPTRPNARWLASGLTALALLLAPVGAALAQTITFNLTRGPQSYTVPAGITRLSVVATGGSGGVYVGENNPGYGAQVRATVSVTPGEVLTVMVGGRGTDGTGGYSLGGYNGGGSTGSLYSTAGAGGGATDLRRATANGSTGDYLGSRNALLVAGGGGGGGAYYGNGPISGGSGGTPNGGNGATWGYPWTSIYVGDEGGGATQTGPGRAGSSNGTSGHPGSNGTGGGGGTNGDGAGGGGGGYYGGGGAALDSGGGGGSSWVTSTGSTTISYAVASATGNGQLTLTPLPAPPTLTSLSPTSGLVGTSVTLTGTNLTGATAVSFNGTAATTYTVNSATQVTATVPVGASNGLVTVTTLGGTSNGLAFTVTTNNALTFNGTNNYVALPSTTPVPVGNSSYTIEAWIKPTSMGVYGIVGWGNYGTQSQTNALRLDPGNGGTIYNYWWNNDLGVQVGNLADGKWHHVAATFNGTTRAIYVDGVLKGSDTPSGHNVLSAANLRLGSTCPTSCGGEYFPGSLDEVRIYNAGLTQVQVQADMFSAASALPGNQVYYANFNQGTAGSNNAGITSLTDQSGNNSTGTLTNFALTGTTSNFVRSFPTIISIAPATGKSGTSVNITGTNLTDATGFAFNGLASAGFTTPTSDLTATATAPVGVLTGPLNLSAATLTRYSGPVFTLVNDLVVTTTTPIAADSYSSITINSPGLGTLAGNVTVSGSTTINSGGTLNDGCFVLSGPGSFTLAAGGSLGICSNQGISAAPATTGSIQNTGSRNFSSDALYTYTGTAAQVTGSGLPATVRTLALSNAAGLTLTAPVAATTAATLTTGVLSTGSNPLTLGTTATLSETATGYATGTVQATRTLSTAGSTEAFGGLGLTLTPNGATLPGSTLVVRTTGTDRPGVGTSQSVKRVFDIQPTVKTGLSVALTLTVRDDERNGIAAINLRLFKSDDAGSTWQGQPATLTPTPASGSQPTTYTASLGGVSNFSLWTLGDAANPLPVQLAAFTAQAEGSGARLRWTTASELDNAYFVVEASADGASFSAMGQVPGHGTTAQPQQYDYFDAELSRYGGPAVYYRLRQVDLSGQRSYSPVQVVAVPAAGQLSLAPNPVSTGAAARLVGAAPGAAVLVLDALGRRVLTTQADAAGTTRLALPAGHYLVRAGAAPALHLVVE